MARYGRDMGRDRWSGGGGYGQGGYGGGQFGGGMNRGQYGGEYGGMGSDANFGGGSQAYGGRSGFGPGGGAYDNDFNAGYGGYGYGGSTGGGSTGGGWSGGQGQGGYGADTGFTGGGYGGTESDWGRGRDLGRGGGYGYGGGQNFGGGAGYTGGGYGGGGQNYGGYGGGWTGSGSDTERGYTGGNYGGSSYGGGGDELRRMRAADVMTDNPECVTPDTSLAEAARKMRDLDVGIIPVVESESSRRLRGVLTDRDIAIRAVAEGKDANATRVMEVMTTQVETCNKNDTLRDVLSVMEREQVRRVPITDREGRLVGIIAQADVATEVDSEQGQRRFADTVEQISEPGNPRGRGNWGGGRASQGRGGREGGGLMGAVRSAVNSLGGGGQDRGGRSGGMQAGGTTGGGMSGGMGTGNDDSRAMNDPGSENV